MVEAGPGAGCRPAWQLATHITAAAAALSQPGADLPGLADGEVKEGGAEGRTVGGVQERVYR